MKQDSCRCSALHKPPRGYDLTRCLKTGSVLHEPPRGFDCLTVSGNSKSFQLTLLFSNLFNRWLHRHQQASRTLADSALYYIITVYKSTEFCGNLAHAQTLDSRFSFFPSPHPPRAWVRGYEWQSWYFVRALHLTLGFF